MIPHTHHFINNDGTLSRVCLICGKTYAELEVEALVQRQAGAMPTYFVIDPTTRKPTPKQARPIPTDPTPLTNTIRPEATSRTIKAAFTADEHQAALDADRLANPGRVFEYKTASEDLNLGEDAPLYHVDKPVKIEIRYAADVESYERTYGDPELIRLLDEEVTEDIHRFESGEIDEV